MTYKAYSLCKVLMGMLTITYPPHSLPKDLKGYGGFSGKSTKKVLVTIRWAHMLRLNLESRIKVTVVNCLGFGDWGYAVSFACE